METIFIQATIIKPKPDIIEDVGAVERHLKDCCEQYTKAAMNSSVNQKELHLIELNENGTIIFRLDSSIPLEYPGKALAHFTKLLLSNSNNDYFIRQLYGNKLFEYKVLSQLPRTDENISVAQLIFGLSCYLEHSKGERSTQQVNAVKTMKRLAVECGLIQI